MGIPTSVILVAFLCTSVVFGLKSCSRNANLMKSIQYQLKLVEDNDGNCDCGQRNHSDVDKVGFLATNSRNIENLSPESVVVYDAVTTNLGNGYNPSTGIFTAPSNGLYSFSWTTLSFRGKYFETNLYLNKEVIARNHAHAAGFSNHISASQNVVLYLKKGNEVSIRTHGVGKFMYNDKWSSFSGFKI